MLVLRQVLTFCVALPLFLQSSGAQTQEVVICTGTQNALSVTGSSEMQYKLMKEMYTGCEIVMGNLEITMMEHGRDISFLKSIREVTGYILIAINQFKRLPLDQLRVIRGNTLYEERFALAVLVNYQKDGQWGLEELGLTHLTEILEGGVQIIQNKFLSYSPQVNWLDIVKDGASEVIINDNGPIASCDEECGGHCWGSSNETCQILTKTVCAPQCNGRCFGKSPSECCHMECAGGCTGPLDTDCFACRNFNNSGSCVPQCPQTLIYNKHTFKVEDNPSAKYQYGSICVAQCPPNFVVDGSSCVSSCPLNKKEVEKKGVKRCEPCGGLCPKACRGTGTTNRETVDSLNIDSFINCTEIQGSLHFLVTGIKGDAYNNISALDPEKLKVFKTVREIKDILSIQSWPESMSDLSVFSNLETIQGRKLYKGYSLLVMKIPTLTSLGLRSLRKINDGGVYITGNSQLCYHDTVNWTRLFSSLPQRPHKTIDIKENQSLNRCVAEGHVCDTLCSSEGCWGPGPNQCLSCQKYSRGGTCVPMCKFLSGDGREFASQDDECMSCHSECKVQTGQPTCTGPGADECVECASLKDGPHCVSSCPEGVMSEKGLIFKYPNYQHQCEPCHLNCTQGCLGPGIEDCLESDRSTSSQATTGIVLGVILACFVGTSIFIMSVLYRRSLAIRRKRAMRRYMASGESFEPLDPSDKGVKVHARILKITELRKIKLLGTGVFGSVHKGVWMPEGDSVKLPVAIKTIHDRTGRQVFHEITDHMLAMGSLDHAHVVRLLGICPGAGMQLVTQLSTQGSLLEHIRHQKDSLNPQRLLNWCVQIAKGMYYLEEHRMVHRNLAARNVLLKNDFIVQISDYGIADLLYPDDKKYFYNESKAPIKWMALESILFRRYTHQSDVWSYGVTVWEIMSYGAEPYTTMRPQEVPDLLEKGERLSQPQICTIDVYMVMVKCWMIDENVRPTFKELANEFTRMARDPPRYLVIKGDCSLSDSGLDEAQQRGPELGDLHGELQGLDEEGLESGMATPPHYMSQSKSLPRLSRMDSHRGISSMAGYLPMTPGVENPGQYMWPSRSRLNSARTVSESSEGRGTVVELEMSEDVSLAGSLRRKRHREDSAYMSQRDSMSGGPPETFSPDTEGEEDHNGYVLPGLGDSPERESLLLSTSQVTLPHERTLSRLPQRSLGLLEDPDSASEEYEYMNKQACMISLSTRQHPSHPKDGSQWLKMNKRPGSSLTPRGKECTGNRTSGSHAGDGKTKNDDNQSTEDSCDSDNIEEQGSGEVEYEYMDIRSVETETNDLPSPDVPQPSETAEERLKVRRKVKKEVIENEYVENDYQYTNSQPRLHQALCGRDGLRLQGEDEEEDYAYEEMDSMAVLGAGNSVEYQNMQGEDEGAFGGQGTQHTGVGTYVKVRAGVGEPGSGDQSFDNPDYWHSRLFLKPNALRT